MMIMMMMMMMMMMVSEVFQLHLNFVKFKVNIVYFYLLSLDYETFFLLTSMGPTYNEFGYHGSLTASFTPTSDVMEYRSLLVVFYFCQNSEWSPME